MFSTIAGFLLSSILLICFLNIRLGTTLYLAYCILVPINDITFGPLHLAGNVVKLILFFSLLYDFKLRHKYNFSWKLLMPFIIYFIVELLIIPFQNETPYGWMYNSWRGAMMASIFGTFVFYNVLVQYPNTIKLYRRSIIISILIAGLYGLYLTTTGGVNPYTTAVILSQGTTIDAEKWLSYYSADDRIFGRISSVFIHPMSFGLFIGLAFIYIFSIKENIKKYLLITLLFILSLDALFCGVRSCIGGLVIAIAVYLLVSKNFKIALLALAIGIVGYYVILQMPDFFNYLGSIIDIHNTKGTVSGSSIDMRIEQLDGCIKEISNSPFLGKGYDWHGYYLKFHGDHPIILAFESLIFIILCDNGILGFFIWVLLIWMVLRTNHKFNLSDKAVADSLFAFYVTYSCITGEYSYMQVFLMFYVCLVFENMKINNNKRYNTLKLKQL